MRRILIFILLGPPLGFAVYLLYSLLAYRSVPLSALVYTPYAYIVGGVPAAIAVGLDYWTKSPGLTAIGGYVATVVFMLLLTTTASLTEFLGFGFLGAISAAVCSWLSSEEQEMRGSMSEIRRDTNQRE